MVRKQTILCSIVIALLAIGQQNFSQTPPSTVDEKPIATKLLEVGSSNDGTFLSKVNGLLESLDRSKWSSWAPEFEMLVVFYGTDRQIAQRKKLFLDAFGEADLYHARITFVHAGKCRAVSTVFWQLPRRAEMPEICKKRVGLIVKDQAVAAKRQREISQR